MTSEQHELIERLKFQKVKVRLTEKGNKYVEHIQTEFANGGIKLFKWKIMNPSSRIFLHKDKIEDVAWEIIRSLKVKGDISEITENEMIEATPDDLKMVNTFDLLGKLSGIAKHGGAYSPINKRLTDTEAIEMSKDFIDEFLPKPFDDSHCFLTYEPWANWFFSVAWDYTAIIFSRQYDELYLICLTDTD
ncbi:MAG: hypothetical protein R2753_10795 [Chitinophagales bacterium]